MIEEFIQNLQQAEVEADGIIKTAKEKVRSIQRDSEASLTKDKISTELSLGRRLDAIDQETNQQMKLAEDQFHTDLKQQLDSLERQTQDHRRVALDFLLSRLTAR